MKYLFLVAIAITITCTGISSTYSQITRNADEFTGEVRLMTPVLEKASLSKFITYKDTSVYLHLKACGATLNVNEKGVIVLFTDGTKLTFSEKIDVKAGDGEYCNYEYTAFCSITVPELTLLSTKTIKAFRLFIYDNHLTDGEAKTFHDNANLIVNAK